MAISADDLIARIEWVGAEGLTHFSARHAEGHLELERAAHAPQPPAISGAASEAAPEPAASDIPAQSAPLSGLCYLAPDPQSAPFVTLGQKVEAGQTLCLIEAMKVLTKVPAKHAGVVKEILVEDGASVEAGAPIVRIMP